MAAADEKTVVPTPAELGSADTVTQQQRPRARAPQMFGGGQQIGRYTVLSPLGEGGFGQVFLAFDENLKRKVALKALYGETDEAQRQRFRREGEALAALAHPNVIAVFDVVEHQGSVVLAMEFVPGQTLTDWALGKGWRELLGGFLQAARGLAAAHESGMVHRDFKPDNVLVGTDGRARVADFGLAARAGPDEPPGARTAPDGAASDSSSALDAELSVAGLVMGTPFYMAPEVRAGDRATEASDQFSFFRALQHLLEGRPRGEQDDDVPAWVDALIVRGLSERQEMRWPDMAAVVRELEARLGVRPELDPRRGMVLRRALLSGMMVFGLGATGLALAVAGDAALEPKVLLGLGVWQFSVAAAFIFFGARVLASAVVGQRVAAVIGMAVTAMLFNRVMAYLWGMPGERVLATDLLLTALACFAGALFAHRWLRIAAATCASAALVSARWPALAAAAFMLSIASMMVLALVFLRRPDLMRPGFLVSDRPER